MSKVKGCYDFHIRNSHKYEGWFVCYTDADHTRQACTLLANGEYGPRP